jgi:hypothetical protein
MPCPTSSLTPDAETREVARDRRVSADLERERVHDSARRTAHSAGDIGRDDSFDRWREPTPTAVFARSKRRNRVLVRMRLFSVMIDARHLDTSSRVQPRRADYRPYDFRRNPSEPARLAGIARTSWSLRRIATAAVVRTVEKRTVKGVSPITTVNQRRITINRVQHHAGVGA